MKKETGKLMVEMKIIKSGRERENKEREREREKKRKKRKRKTSDGKRGR